MYRAAVVGLGRMGSSYPEETSARTHTGAYAHTQGIAPVAFCDPSPQARHAHTERWGNILGEIPVLASLKELAEYGPFDVVSICTPTPLLAETTVRAWRILTPRVLFVEKPLATSLAAAKPLLPLLDDKNTAVFVNYHRGLDPAHQIFFQTLKQNGPALGVRVAYCKGLFNYASHFLALLLTHFGPVIDVVPLAPGAANLSDPSPSFLLRMEAGFSALFQGFDNVGYDLFELDVFLKEDVFSLQAGGCRRRRLRPVEGLYYPGYAQLEEGTPLATTDPTSILLDGPVEGLGQSVQAIVDYLDDPTRTGPCSLSTALAVLEIMETVQAAYATSRA